MLKIQMQQNNKLILENGELSSVYFCKPSIGNCGVPNNSQKGDRFKYLITAAFTDREGDLTIKPF